MALSGTIAARNNLALCYFLQHDFRRALDILSPSLSSEDNPFSGANPFTYALAAQAAVELGRADQAKQWLTQAIAAFDALIALEKRSLGRMPDAYREYALSIMRAAARLDDHRLVLELYRRWRAYHLSWENAYLAGIAAFNLKKYGQAAKLWMSLAGDHPSAREMQQIALMVDRNIIPPFPLPYSDKAALSTIKLLEETDAEAPLSVELDGFARMMLLTVVLKEKETKAAEDAVRTLVVLGGEWGEELARRLLKSPSFSREVKTAALFGLLKRGAVQEGEPVQAVIDGREQTIEVRSQEVIMESDAALDRIVDKARALKEAGNIDEAIERLHRLVHDKNIFYPPAALVLANLYRQKQLFQEAMSLLAALEKLLPDNPVVLFNLAALMWELGEIREARRYFERIDRASFPQDQKDKLFFLESRLGLAVFSEHLKTMYEQRMRQSVEDKPLPIAPRLSQGLKNMPAEWLEGACRRFGLDPARRRRDREKQVLDFLMQKDNLLNVLGELEEEGRSLLSYVLQKGGWSRIAPITRRFGSMEGDGYFWEHEEPESPLGRLWIRGLILVGRAVIDGRRTKIAAIPVEFRETLAELLSL